MWKVGNIAPVMCWAWTPRMGSTSLRSAASRSSFLLTRRPGSPRFASRKRRATWTTGICASGVSRALEDQLGVAADTNVDAALTRVLAATRSDLTAFKRMPGWPRHPVGCCATHHLCDLHHERPARSHRAMPRCRRGLRQVRGGRARDRQKWQSGGQQPRLPLAPIRRRLDDRAVAGGRAASICSRRDQP
jgi:hypothetical protein